MRIPKGTHVIHVSCVGLEAVSRGPGSLISYRDLHAGRLTEGFGFGRGEIIVIDGPLGGEIPTREAAFEAFLHRDRFVGVEFWLPDPQGWRIRHLMMVEPSRNPTPIDPRIAWPKHLDVVRDKFEILKRAYDDGALYGFFADL